MENNNTIQAALAAGAASVQPVTTHGGVPFVAVPDGYKIHDIENLLLVPTRKRADVTITDTDSFIFYANKHGEPDTATIYADIDAEASRFNLIGVLNDHGAESDEAQWRDHRCTFQPAQAVEWKRWLGKNKVHFTQTDFAAWLEENLPDIASVAGMPSGADILKMALGFEANSDKKLRSKVNLQDGGVQFEFVDDATLETRTTMRAFERFTLGLPVFDGSASAYPLEARLKYREKDSKLTFWYELIRPDRIFKTAVADELRRIKVETGLLVVSGTP